MTWLVSLVLGACHHGGDGDGGPSGPPGSDDGTDSDAGSGGGVWHGVGTVGATGLRRLSRDELRRSLEAVLGPLPDPLFDGIPLEAETPFDNDYTTQTSSSTLVDGMYALADGVASTILADDALRDALLGCTPSGPGDDACLRALAATLGRRLLRRSLTDAELDGYAAFAAHGEQEHDFDVGARSVIVSLVLDAAFLYRIETGTPDPDDPSTIALDGPSLATRLALLLWGTGPDDALVTRAENGELDDPAGVRDVATEMLRDPRGLAQLQRFHAMWIDYDDLAGGGALAEAMRRETDALVERAVAERSWSTLLTADQTFVDAELAAHYDMDVDVDDVPQWVSYPDERRAGLLSHGSFLAIGAKFGDTSPVERGKAVWTRLLCRDIPPPPPDVDTGLPPVGGGPNACKADRYDMSRRAECRSCHGILDPIGFGLENYGPSGEWRTHELDRPDCPIDGQGAVAGLDDFAGAPSLGALLAASGEVEACLTERYLQYAIGRAAGPDEDELVAAMADRLRDDGDLLALVLDFVASPAFTQRKVEP